MKKIDSPVKVSLIKKQLEMQTKEHDLLENQILDHEQFLKVNTKQCSFFVFRQESGCSGYQIIPTRPLKKLFLSVFFFWFLWTCFFFALLSSFLLEEQRLWTKREKRVTTEQV